MRIKTWMMTTAAVLCLLLVVASGTIAAFSSRQTALEAINSQDRLTDTLDEQIENESLDPFADSTDAAENQTDAEPASDADTNTAEQPSDGTSSPAAQTEPNDAAANTAEQPVTPANDTNTAEMPIEDFPIEDLPIDDFPIETEIIDEPLPASGSSNLNATYNSYVKRVDSLSAQANSVRSIDAAWELLYKMEMLSDEIDFLEDEAEWNGNWTLKQKCDRLDDRLDLAKDRLEYTWRIDD